MHTKPTLKVDVVVQHTRIEGLAVEHVLRVRERTLRIRRSHPKSGFVVRVFTVPHARHRAV